MANPSLKHYSLQNGSIDAWLAVGAAPAAGRALVAKVIVANQQGSTPLSFALSLGAAGGGANIIAWNITLNAGEVYTESGLVALAGEQVYIRVIGGSVNSAAVAVCGEEIDN